MSVKRLIKIGINGIYGLLISLILISLLQYINGSNELVNLIPLHNWFVLVVVSIVLSGLIYLIRSKNIHLSISSHKMKQILIVSSLIVFIIQIFFAYQIYFYTGWDASAVRNAAFYFIEHPEKIKKYFNFYFSYHTNQTTITVILGLIMRFFHMLGVKNVYFGTIVFSILSVNLSTLFISLSMNKFIENKLNVLLGFLLCTFLCSFSPWIIIPYSDTYMMFFASFAFYLYLSLKDNQYDILKWLLLFSSIFIGSLIKPQTLIMGIAIVLYEFVFKRKDSIKSEVIRILKVGLILLLTFFLSSQLHKTFVQMGQFELDPEYSFTLPHYLMVGLNPESYGAYVAEDAEVSYGQFTVEDREAKNFEIIKERIDYLNQKGWISFLVNKAVVNFNDGSFAWGREGDFYQEIFDKDNLFAKALRSYFYHDGDSFESFLLLRQILWMIVITLMATSIFNRKKDEEVFVQIICIGIILFNMIFEARARYLFAYVPYFVLLATLSFNDLVLTKGFMNKKD
jgi:hypothetical protein